MSESIEISFDLPVYPERFFRAWMDGWEHGRMTGSSAAITAQVGGAFSALSGLAEGEFLALTPFDWQRYYLPLQAPVAVVAGIGVVRFAWYIVTALLPVSPEA